jgi:hypothetical protein
MRAVAALVILSLAPPGVPVRVMLDRPVYAPGLSGHVQVLSGQDGYLLVLHADPEGRVRVAYPLDPGAPNHVRAGDQIDITAHGWRPAFAVKDTVGSGKWFAAISTVPFQSDSFVRGTHWDYRHFPTLAPEQDWDAALTALVTALARGRFDYDVATYRVVPAPTPSTTPRSRGPEDPYSVPRYPGVRM